VYVYRSTQMRSFRSSAEREMIKEREREIKRKRERERERDYVHVCVIDTSGNGMLLRVVILCWKKEKGRDLYI
jgi:hypothetical protein